MNLHFFLSRGFIVVVPLFFVACAVDNDEIRRTSSFAAALRNDSLSLRDASDLVSADLLLLFCDNDTVPLNRFNRTFDSTAHAAAEYLSNDTRNRSCREEILTTVYTEWKIGFDRRDTIIESLLPCLVFRDRKGGCLGVSFILLMLAEKLDCPIRGVRLPGHFFCRYENGIERINIEPNRRGCFHPDSYYYERYALEKQPWYDLRSLTTSSVIGVLCYNAGVCCLQRKKYHHAIVYFSESLRRIPDFFEAKGNLALAFAKQDRLDTAMVLFEEIFSKYPGLPNLAANYGAVACAAGKYKKAIGIYGKGLFYFPDDTVIRKGLSAASRHR